MYFFNEEEKLYLHKGLIPESRNMHFDYDLRGWNWNKPPLEPVYDMELGVAEIANNYCPTDRDLFLKKIYDEYFKPNQKMVEGLIFHKTISEFITYSKKVLYSQSIKTVNNPDILVINEDVLNNILDTNLKIRNRKELERKIKLLWNFEKRRIEHRLQEVMANQQYIGLDALMYQVLPVVVEQKLNGSFLGLSSQLSTDAITFSEPIIVDIKFGRKRDFHKLSVTGYALTMEALHSFPVNIGCIVYPELKEGRVLLDRDIFIITDELRQKFIERRDEKMRMLYEEIDPGKLDNCYKTCPFYKKCNNFEG